MESSIIPLQAYLIKPIYYEEVIIDKNILNQFGTKRDKRIIFYLKDTQLQETEKEVIGLLISSISSCLKSLDTKRSIFTEDRLRAIALRCFHLESFIISKAQKRLMTFLEYEDKYYSKVSKIESSGILYVYGRDEFMRPNLYFSIKEYLSFEKYAKSKKVKIVEVLKEYLMYMLRNIEQKLFLPGQIESINIIIDLCDSESSNILRVPEILLSVIDEFISSYIFNINRIFLIRSDALRYSIIIGFINKYCSSYKLIYNMNPYEKSCLLKYIHETNIQKVHGGTGVNVNKINSFDQYANVSSVYSNSTEQFLLPIFPTPIISIPFSSVDLKSLDRPTISLAEFVSTVASSLFLTFAE